MKTKFFALVLGVLLTIPCALRAEEIVKASHHVTSTKPEGNVVVENGGDLRIKASSVTLDTGTRVKLGGKLTISQ